MSGYEFQSVDHDASISAEYTSHPSGDQAQVTVSITRGEVAFASITMWTDDFIAMVAELAASDESFRDTVDALRELARREETR